MGGRKIGNRSSSEKIETDEEQDASYGKIKDKINDFLTDSGKDKDGFDEQEGFDSDEEEEIEKKLNELKEKTDKIKFLKIFLEGMKLEDKPKKSTRATRRKANSEKVDEGKAKKEEQEKAKKLQEEQDKKEEERKAMKKAEKLLGKADRIKDEFNGNEGITDAYNDFKEVYDDALKDGKIESKEGIVFDSELKNIQDEFRDLTSVYKKEQARKAAIEEKTAIEEAKAKMKSKNSATSSTFSDSARGATASSDKTKNTSTTQKAEGEEAEISTDNANNAANMADTGTTSTASSEDGKRGDSTSKQAQSALSQAEITKKSIEQNKEHITGLITQIESKAQELSVILNANDFDPEKAKQKIIQIKAEIQIIKDKLVIAYGKAGNLRNKYITVKDLFIKAEALFKTQELIYKSKTQEANSNLSEAEHKIQREIQLMLKKVQEYKLQFKGDQDILEQISDFTSQVSKLSKDGITDSSWFGIGDGEIGEIRDAFGEIGTKIHKEKNKRTNYLTLKGKAQYAESLHSTYNVPENEKLILEIRDIISTHREQGLIQRGIDKTAILHKIEIRKELMAKNIIRSKFDEIDKLYKLSGGDENNTTKSAREKYGKIKKLKEALLGKGNIEISLLEVDKFNRVAYELESELSIDGGNEAYKQNIEKRQTALNKKISDFYNTHKEKLLGTELQDFKKLFSSGNIDLTSISESEKKLSFMKNLLSIIDSATLQGYSKEDKKALNNVLKNILARGSSLVELENTLQIFINQSNTIQKKASDIASEKLEGLSFYNYQTSNLIEKYADDIDMMTLIKGTNNSDHIYTLLTEAAKQKEEGSFNLKTWLGEIVHTTDYSQKDIDADFGYLKWDTTRNTENEIAIAKLLIVNKDGPYSKEAFQLAKYALDNNITGHEIIAQSIRAILKGNATIENVLQSGNKDIQRSKGLSNLGIDPTTQKQRLYTPKSIAGDGYLLYSKNGSDSAITHSEMFQKIKNGETFEKKTIVALIYFYSESGEPIPKNILTQAKAVLQSDKDRSFLESYATNEKDIDTILRESVGEVKAIDVDILNLIKNGNSQEIIDYIGNNTDRKLDIAELYQDYPELMEQLKKDAETNPVSQRLLDILEIGGKVAKSDAENMKLNYQLKAEYITIATNLLNKKLTGVEYDREKISDLQDKLREFINTATSKETLQDDIVTFLEGIDVTLSVDESKVLLETIQLSTSNNIVTNSIVQGAAVSVIENDSSNAGDIEKAKDLLAAASQSQGKSELLQHDIEQTIDIRAGDLAGGNNSSTFALTYSSVVQSSPYSAGQTSILDRINERKTAYERGEYSAVAAENISNTSVVQAFKDATLVSKKPFSTEMSPVIRQSVVQRVVESYSTVVDNPQQSTVEVRSVIQKYKETLLQKPTEDLFSAEKAAIESLNNYDFTSPAIPYTPKNPIASISDIPKLAPGSNIKLGGTIKTIIAPGIVVDYSSNGESSEARHITYMEGSESREIKMTRSEQDKIGNNIEGIKNMVNFKGIMDDVGFGDKIWDNREGIITTIQNGPNGLDMTMGAEHFSEKQIMKFFNAILIMTHRRTLSTNNYKAYIVDFKEINGVSVTKNEKDGITGESKIGKDFIDLYIRRKGRLDTEVMKKALEWGTKSTEELNTFSPEELKEIQKLTLNPTETGENVTLSKNEITKIHKKAKQKKPTFDQKQLDAIKALMNM